MTDSEIIDAIIAREGGYTDHPLDHGGPTNFGITLAVLSEWRQMDCSAYDVQELTEAEARLIYQHVYIAAPGFTKIADDRLRSLAVDWGVNSGPGTVIKALQQIAGVKQDGVLGPVTLSALSLLDGKLVYLRMCAARIRFIGRLITNHPDQGVFAAGWLSRLAEFVEA